MNIFEKIISTFIVLSLFGVTALIVMVIAEIPEYSKRQDEWISKVNNCVLNPNYREDCKLILYKYEQENIKEGNSSTTVYPMPIVVR